MIRGWEGLGMRPVEESDTALGRRAVEDERGLFLFSLVGGWPAVLSVLVVFVIGPVSGASVVSSSIRQWSVVVWLSI